MAEEIAKTQILLKSTEKLEEAEFIQENLVIMCFNLSISSNHVDIEIKLNAKFETELIFEPQKHISAFSNPLIPVITSEDNSKIQSCHWGLIPEWVKDATKANEIRKMTYNAKCETIKIKPSFRNSIKDRKCLIIFQAYVS